MDRLRIAHVLPSFAWGGTQALSVIFAEHAARLNVELTVISLAATNGTPYAAQLQDHGAKVIVLEGQSVIDPRRILRMVGLLRTEQIALVHASLTRPNTLAPLAGALARCPVLAGLHTLPANDTPRARHRAKLEAFAVRRSAGIISCADSIAAAEAARFAPVPIQVLSNPAPSLGAPRPARPGDQPLRFIAIGRLSPEKGFDILLAAAAKLKQKGHAFSIIIVGDGHLRASLKVQKSALGLDDVVTFTGARDDVTACLRAADVYVSPSRFEGLSIALLEAMAQGLPVIATPVGDTGGLVTSDVGIAIEPDNIASLSDAMVAMIESPAAVLTCGQAAQKRIAETRAPGQWAEKLVAIYQNTITTYREGSR